MREQEDGGCHLCRHRRGGRGMRMPHQVWQEWEFAVGRRRTGLPLSIGLVQWEQQEGQRNATPDAKVMEEW